MNEIRGSRERNGMRIDKLGRLMNEESTDHLAEQDAADSFSHE
jgi:hypothetical protein